MQIPQSTSKLVMFKAYSDTDHVTEATGKTIAITISKNGGAFGNPNAGATNATEVSSGWYKVTLDTTDTNTLGPVAVRGAQADIDDVGVLFEVVSASTGGLTNLDAAITSRMATYTQPTGFLSATFPSGTVANTTNITAGTITTVSTVTGLTVAHIDAAISTRATQTSVDDLPTNAELATALGTADDAVLAQIALVKAQTDLLTFTVAGQVDANIESVNGTTVTGAGSEADPWGP
jgi:hypothetical protein